jgi:putative DNA primase/helicase
MSAISFHEAAASIGCIIRNLNEDDRIHRCATDTHPKKKNGAYRSDGRRGWIRNWETFALAVWHEERDERRRGPVKPLPDLAKRRAEEAAAARFAAETAQHMVKTAAWATHPYLERKGFPKALGLVLEDMLLVPGRINGRITTLQKIYADGRKMSLKNGSIGGASFSIGDGPLEILCEGYATGLSIKAALSGMCVRARVTCCFAAANVAEVASKRPRALIVTDNDKPIPQLGGLGTGEYFARRTGLPWAMPPVLGTDANDLHLSAGLPALQRLLLDLMQRRSCAA